MKKTLALLLAALMLLGVLAGCTNGGGSTTSGGAIVGSDEVDTTVSDEYEYRMPIAENATLSIWASFSSNVIDSPAERKCNIEMEKRTGVHTEWQLVSTSNVQESFNLMVMSQTYTDLINITRSYYTGGMDKAIEDEVYLRLNDYVVKWAPNFLRMMNRDEATRRQQLTDQGNIAYFGSIQNPQPAWVGAMIRQDWLEDAGLASPVTYDDWYNILKTFKAEHGATMALTYSGYNSISQSTNAGFDVGINFYNEEGTVKYGFIEDGFRDYLTLMHQWYTEGLIDPDFYTRVTEYFGASTDMITGGQVGIFDHMYTMPHLFAALSGDPNYHAKAIPAPVQNVGDVAHFRRVNFELGDSGTAVTPAVLDDPEKLEIAIRWMDYRYTDEGSELLTWGILGESYEYDANGDPQFLPVVYDNPEISFTDASDMYREKSSGQWYRWECENIIVSPEELEAYDIWNQADGAWVMPNSTLTTEEGQEYSAIYGDIQTFVQESIPAFITGAKPLSDWDSYVAQIKSLNIDRCIELQQAALDRYYAR